MEFRAMSAKIAVDAASFAGRGLHLLDDGKACRNKRDMREQVSFLLI